MTFGNRLRSIRREHLVKQKELANFLNIGVSTLSQYENDKRHPNFELLVKIASFFNVSTDYLLGIVEYKSLSLTRSLEHIDQSLSGSFSYHDLMYKISENLITMYENKDIKSLEILHQLYQSISAIGIEYNPQSSAQSIEDILSTHLTHKENIDQTLNRLFRHHIKLSSTKTN